MTDTATETSAQEPAVEVPHKSVAAINRFAAAHGEGAQAVLQYVGVGAVRITLVGTDGTLGDVVVRDMATAEATVEASAAELGEWDRELTNAATLPEGHRRKMAGYLAR